MRKDRRVLASWYGGCTRRLCVEEDGSGGRWTNLDLVLRTLKVPDLGDHQRTGCVSGGSEESVLVLLVVRVEVVSCEPSPVR